MRRFMLLTIILFPFYAKAEESDTGISINQSRAYEPHKKPENSNNWFITDDEFKMALPILAVFLLVFILEIWLVKTAKFTEEATIKLIVVSLVVFSCLFVMIAGFDDKQLAPIFGLFGTICGYLFGREERKTSINN